MGKLSWKDLVEEVAGIEEDVLVYDFDAPKGSGKFYERARQDGQGIYDDELTGGESGE